MGCQDSTQSSSYLANSSYYRTTNNPKVMGELLNYCHTQVRLMVNADKNPYFKRQLKKNPNKLKRGLFSFSQGNCKAK